MAITAAVKAMIPGDTTITIKQGSTYYQEYEIKDGGSLIDTTGITASGKVRDTFGGTILATFVCTIPTLGKVVVELTPAITAALTAVYPSPADRAIIFGVHDIEITDGTDTVRIVQGQAVLSREATV